MNPHQETGSLSAIIFKNEMRKAFRSKPPSIPTALKFRAEQMGWNQTQMAKRLGLMQSHYSEVLSGKIELPKNAMRKAYRLGVPAEVLLQ